MKYVCFLRGINVGGRVVKMSDLAACFEQVGLRNVRTILQSGNVLFESDEKPDVLKSQIETSLTETFHYPAKVQLCTLEQVENIINAYPFDRDNKENHHYVIFMELNKEQELATEAEYDHTIEKVELGVGCLYWMVPKGMTLKSGFSKYLTKAKYKEFNTVRNLNTLEKVVRKI